MNILEMKEQIIRMQDELDAIINNGEAEKRELNEDETNKMAELRADIDELRSQIAEEERKNVELNKNKSNVKMEKEVRLFDLVKGIVEGNITDEQRAYVQGNNISFRAPIQATTTEHGE